MKTYIVFWLFAFFSCTVVAQNFNADFFPTWGNIPFTGSIHFAGNWKGDDFGNDTGSRSIQYIPVGATIKEQGILVSFYEPAGNVEVIIRKDGENVYAESLSVASSMTCVVYTEKYPAGIYSLEISNPDGGRLIGWFEIIN